MNEWGGGLRREQATDGWMDGWTDGRRTIVWFCVISEVLVGRGMRFGFGLGFGCVRSRSVWILVIARLRMS